MLNYRSLLIFSSYLILWVGLSLPTQAQDSALVAELEESVVRVLNPQFDSRGKLSGLSTGTGVIINKDGYIATNHHVIKGHKKLLIAVHGRKKLIDVEKVIWKSINKDLAILKINGIFDKPASFSTETPDKADRVLALGYPGVADRLVSKEQGLMGMMAREATLTTGVVGRKFNAPWGGRGSEDISIVQHSAQINKGNSGGPLFDGCGRVVGINTQTSLSTVKGVAATGVFFASDVNELLNVMDQREIAYKRFTRVCRAEGASHNYVIYLFALGSLLSLIVAFFALRRPVMATVERASQRVSSPANGVKPTATGKISHRQRQSLSPQSNRHARGRICLSGLDNLGHVLRFDFDRSEARRSRDGYVIGRHPELCHGVVSDNLVSKRQCRVFDADGSIMIEDLNATNVTEVNSRALDAYSPVSLSTGDEVLIGSTQFSVTIS